MKTKIFFDCEFTGLHQNTTLISIGFISNCGKTFYAEFTDYDKTQVNDWIKENIIEKLKFKEEIKKHGEEIFNDRYYVQSRTPDNPVGNNINKGFNLDMEGNSKEIKEELIVWFNQFKEVEIWSDCLSYDWVLFNSLLADYSDGYPQLPKNIDYIPYDICTLFKMKGIDSDISREEFTKEGTVGLGSKEGEKHNALYDAKIIRLCFYKLIK